MNLDKIGSFVSTNILPVILVIGGLVVTMVPATIVQTAVALGVAGMGVAQIVRNLLPSKGSNNGETQ